MNKNKFVVSGFDACGFVNLVDFVNHDNQDWEAEAADMLEDASCRDIKELRSAADMLERGWKNCLNSAGRYLKGQKAEGEACKKWAEAAREKAEELERIEGDSVQEGAEERQAREKGFIE